MTNFVIVNAVVISRACVCTTPVYRRACVRIREPIADAYFFVVDSVEDALLDWI